MNIVIFGACSAIAQAAARLWAMRSASFVLLDRNEARLKIVADDLTTRGAKNVYTIAADLTHIDKHAALIKQIHNLFTTPYPLQPTIYLFAYGTLGNQKAGEQDFGIAEQELRTNFISVASLLTHLVNELTHPHLLSPSVIAVISSVAGDRGRASHYIYGTAKGALTIWLAGLRNRLAKEHSNIHVLTIKPGLIDTPMTKDFKKGLLWSSPERVAADIVRAVDKRKDVIYTPWFWRYIMLVLRLIPERIFKKLTL